MLRLFSLFLIAGLSYPFVSCAQVYFSRPLPVDAENRYKFPSSLRGSFKDQKSFYVVTKKAFIHFESDEFYVENSDSLWWENTSELFFHKAATPFQLRNGKLDFYKFSKSSFELNQDQFLRKASKDVYVLNKQIGDNWKVNPIVRKSARELEVLYLYKRDVVEELKDGELLDVFWTKEDIIQRINDGLFSVDRTYYRTKRRYTFDLVKTPEIIKMEDN
ncbi:hypothetical protein [Shivajiella indica]|uniref:Outer membrane lipoprotein carrier protein LolA n=1 Tax=Shivajiella indica TaxID=872115 RepID=A0ABW5B8S6_9BACT